MTLYLAKELHSKTRYWCKEERSDEKTKK